MRKQPMPLSAQNRRAASKASAFSMQRRLNFARASDRFILPMEVAVVVTNLMGWSRNRQHRPRRMKLL